MTALQPQIFPDLEGADFIRSDEVAEVGDEVLRLHGQAGGVGRLLQVARAIREGEVAVLWLLNAKPFDVLNERLEHDTAGKCLKAPRLWHDVTGYHVAIWIRQHFWDEWTPDVRRAAILHELLHVEVERDKNDQAKVRIRKHDVEDFVDVARLYGPIFGEAGAYTRAATVRPAADIVSPLRDLADKTGSDITITAGDRSATIRSRKPKAE